MGESLDWWLELGKGEGSVVRKTGVQVLGLCLFSCIRHVMVLL